MNEQLQNALAEILGKTLNGIDAASAFFFSELPDVIQQLLTWYAVKGFITMLIGLFVWYIPFVSYKKLNARYKNKCGYKNFGDDVGIPVLFISLLVLLISLELLNFYWLQILLAPKVWLIEYSSNLVK